MELNKISAEGHGRGPNRSLLTEAVLYARVRALETMKFGTHSLYDICSAIIQTSSAFCGLVPKKHELLKFAIRDLYNLSQRTAKLTKSLVKPSHGRRRTARYPLYLARENKRINALVEMGRSGAEMEYSTQIQSTNPSIRDIPNNPDNPKIEVI
jgi:hypothetical protein